MEISTKTRLLHRQLHSAKTATTVVECGVILSKTEPIGEEAENLYVIVVDD